MLRERRVKNMLKYPKEIRKCNHCQKEFTTNAINNKKFCNNKCHKEHLKQQSLAFVPVGYEHQCEHCQKIYYTNRKVQRFCSVECSSHQTLTGRKLYGKYSEQMLIDIIDCLPSFDYSQLVTMHKKREFDLQILVRRCLKLKIAMEKNEKETVH